MVFYRTAYKLHGIRESAIIAHCPACIVYASGVSSDVVCIFADVGDTYAVNCEHCNAAIGVSAGIYFDCLHGCMILEWHVTGFGNIDHKAADGLNDVVEDYHGGNDSE